MTSTDRDALIALYESTDGKAWKKNDNWGSTAPLSEWIGLEVDDKERVVKIDLADNNLRGTIPPELGNLAALKYLRLQDNELSGAIPPELGQLVALLRLELGWNALSGHIPPELGNLAVLTMLDLKGNNLSGHIPPELGNLAVLTILDLEGNNLSGPIPPELGKLAALKDLRLGRNQLTGLIPKELGAHSKLKMLNLAFNKLTGPIPAALGALSELEKLWLSDNKLTGTIPPQLGNLAGLKYLWLQGNELSGTIPASLGKLGNLQELDLSANKLSGPIPPELWNLASLRSLELHYNELSGSIPKELGGLSELQQLHLHGNQLTGTIPKELGRLIAPKELSLYHNNLLRHLSKFSKRYEESGVSRSSWTARGRQPTRMSRIAKGGANTRGDSGSCHGSDRGSSCGSNRASSHGSGAGSSHGSNHGRYNFSGLSREPSPTGVFMVCERFRKGAPQAGAEETEETVKECNTEEPRSKSAAPEAKRRGTAKKVTILENMEVEDASRVSNGGGVRLSVPGESLRGKIGPITVQEMAEVVDGSDDSDFVLLRSVHCLPSPCDFLKPLTLDFNVREGRVRWWWDRAAVREEVLRDYQVLFKQSEDDPWQEMNLEDVSVVFNVEGFTCLRARIKHFSGFGLSWRKQKNDNSTNRVFSHGLMSTSVLVSNATKSVAHVTSLPTSFTTTKEAAKTVAVTFYEASVSFGSGKKTEKIMLPTNNSSEIIPAGGTTELFLSDDATQMKVIICFLPDRSKDAHSSSSTQGASPSSGTSLAGRQASTPRPQGAQGGVVVATSPSGVRSSRQKSRFAPPRSGLLNYFRAPAQPGAEQEDSPTETEEMVYSMTKTLPGGRKLELLKDPVNRAIKIEKNARSLESYAVMLTGIAASPS